MGYNYAGKLWFREGMTIQELNEVKKFLGQDCRNHAEWLNSDGLYHFDLMLSEDMLGLVESEDADKAEDLTPYINMLINNMRHRGFEEFTLTGELLGQGDDPDDRFILRMVDGVATRIDLSVMSVEGVGGIVLDEATILNWITQAYLLGMSNRPLDGSGLMSKVHDYINSKKS